MSKKENNPLKIMGWGALIALILNGIKQLIEIDDGKKDEFSWEEFAKWGLGGAGAGLAVGLILDTLSKDDEGEPEFRETKYLRSVLRSHDPRNAPDYNIQEKKAAEIVAAIKDEFGSFIHKVSRSGSTGKGTANAGSSDIDLVVAYQKHSFRSIEEMFNETYNFLKWYKAGDSEIVRIRKQGKSIGLKCRVRGFEFDIDIVPGKERKNYRIDGDLSLHARSGLFREDISYIKTNISKHKENLPNSPAAKEIVRLLKVWKTKEEIPVSGFELEQLVTISFNRNASKIPRTLYSKLKLTIEFIYDRIDTISVSDPGVPSKRLLQNVSNRKTIKRALGYVLKNIEKDPRNLMYHFPINTDD